MIKRALIKAALTLPLTVKQIIVNLGFNIGREHFQTLATRYLFAPEMRRGLEFLREKGFKPDRILDIGAFEGGWTELAQSVWPAADCVMVEANPTKANFLRRKGGRARVVETLLGADERNVSFYIMESGSSVLEENSPLDRERVTLKQRTLDSLEISADLIKIDVQGYELQVLSGGRETLAKSQAVVIELSLLEINKGCPLLDEALSFMRKENFVAYDILELHRRPLDGAMNQIDVLFVRVDSAVRADKRHYA